MTRVFLNALTVEDNRITTENGAAVYKSLGSDLLDFWANGGALRSRCEGDAVRMFSRAYAENPNLAIIMAFYFRDIRGGQGQRNAFRLQMNWLADNAPDVARNLLTQIPVYGRWDDLYHFVGTKVEENMLNVIREQIGLDWFGYMNDQPISLLAKWLKSENASSKVTKELGKLTRKALGLSPKQYRKRLSVLREYLDVVERKITAGHWDRVNYPAVPSRAMLQYRKAFAKYDGIRFEEYIQSALKGEINVNSSTLYPHDIVGKLMQDDIENDLAQAMWNALPNFIPEDKPENAIAVIDVSGSMEGTPMEVAIGLGMYLAERATGVYKDTFITFSEKPRLEKIIGKTISQRVSNISRADWSMNTNIEAVFDLILKTAVGNQISQEDMIDKLYIISDMEFDQAQSKSSFGGRMKIPTFEEWVNPKTGAVKRITTGFTIEDKVENKKSLFQTIEDKFKAAGYVMPKLVFWNVDSRQTQTPMTMDERGFQSVSGFSPSIFKHLMAGEFVDNEQLILDVLLSGRYQPLLEALQSS